MFIENENLVDESTENVEELTTEEIDQESTESDVVDILLQVMKRWNKSKKKHLLKHK